MLNVPQVRRTLAGGGGGLVLAAQGNEIQVAAVAEL